MLHFFRQIRRKLIEEDHLRKYIWYAIGEIALVMVGILLALQVNNWNQKQASLNDTKNYLEKKLDNLEEDIIQLENLYDHRLALANACKKMLDIGLVNAEDQEISELITNVSIERRFSTSNSKEQVSGLVNYYKNIDGTIIDDLEKEYFNMIDIVTFSENRLNIFSENLESDLWRSGFFNDNRKYFNEIRGDSIKNEQNLYDLPPLVLPEGQALKSVNAILRRNEINSGRLNQQYDELIEINRSLQSAILDFLQKNGGA